MRPHFTGCGRNVFEATPSRRLTQGGIMADQVAESLGKILHILRGAPRPTHAQIEALAHAMGQVLDDMGPGPITTSTCPYTKAMARIAFEPWADYADGDGTALMSLDEARQIVAVCDR
jgi:hypothetical protein